MHSHHRTSSPDARHPPSNSMIAHLRTSSLPGLTPSPHPPVTIPWPHLTSHLLAMPLPRLSPSQHPATTLR
eukprot:12921000-Prorocentrum_lima.AAC.1